MIYDLNNPYEVEEFKKCSLKLLEKKAIIEVKKKQPNRTIKQNSYLHLILSYFACEIGYSIEEVKLDYFKKVCNRDLFERKKVNNKGVKITYMRSSSELDTMEMTTAIERFRNYSAAQAGLYLPSPNENQFLAHIEKEIEKYKDFI